jgi:hypothetical protein
LAICLPAFCAVCRLEIGDTAGWETCATFPARSGLQSLNRRWGKRQLPASLEFGHFAGGA